MGCKNSLLKSQVNFENDFLKITNRYIFKFKELQKVLK